MTIPSAPVTPATPPDPGPRPGAWGRFAQRHLFDYNPAATRRWLALALAGLLITGWALQQVLALPWMVLAQVQLGIGLVALAACFPVQIPRTKYTLGVADVFVFALLALHGAPAAILAAAAEGLVGTLRSSKRLTSRVSSPSAAALGMALCGGVHQASQSALLSLGWSATLADLAAVCDSIRPCLSDRCRLIQ